MSSTKISSLEKRFYFSFWTGTILYSMYRFQASSEEILISPNGTSHYLESGWDWTGRKRDATDYEYSVFAPLLLNWLPFVTLHLIVSQLLLKRFSQFVKIFSITLSFFWLYLFVGLRLSLVLFLQPLIFFYLFKCASFISVWAYFLSSLIISQSQNPLCQSMKRTIYGDTSHHDSYALTIIFCWTQCRCISAVYDTRKNSVPLRQWIENAYHYCFYLPLFASGPLVLYHQFQESVLQFMEKAKNRSWNGYRFVSDLVQVLRYMFWGFVFHKFALHYFYHTVLSYFYMDELKEKLDIWSISGMSFSLGLFFATKYMLIYGLPSAIARMDGIEAPGAPKCTLHIHLYSQMWRDFDRGFYNFMFHYIFLPFVKSENILVKHGGRFISKLIGSALCFAFVYIWHGYTPSVMWWCICNYIGIILETTAIHLSNNPSPLATCKANWTEANWQRFVAAVGAPLQFASMLFSMGFLSFSTQFVSIAFDKCFLKAGLFGLSWILTAFYSCGHVAIALESNYYKSKSGVKSPNTEKEN